MEKIYVKNGQENCHVCGRYMNGVSKERHSFGTKVNVHCPRHWNVSTEGTIVENIEEFTKNFRRSHVRVV